MKKGRHRRFEEARSLKRAVEVVAEPCPECGADPEDDHASWCLYEASELDEDEAGEGESDEDDELPSYEGGLGQNGNGAESHS